MSRLVRVGVTLVVTALALLYLAWKIDVSEAVDILSEASFGYVVLAWDAVLHGASDLRDGHNVVLHEFAHQLDQEDGVSDGVPLFDGPLQYGQWARILERDFEELVKQSDLGRRTVLDAYGATNKAEFFAVATETFFEKPDALKKGYPELYELLEEFYGARPDD